MARSAKGIIVITIPVGNIAPKEVPHYLRKATRHLKTKQLKASGYVIWIKPSRESRDPNIEVLYL